MANDRLLLLALLEEVLGTYKMYRKQTEAAFFCPACGHHKKKLQVNIQTGGWHCWVCQVDNKMGGKSFFSLFKKINATPEQFARLTEIIGESRPAIDDGTVSAYDADVKILPKEFLSLTKVSNSPMYQHAIHYLMRRGVTAMDVVKYNIGYADEGKYKNKVIVPSYDEEGKLNFFVCRAFMKDDPYTHQLPDWTKDIVGFECFVNWNMPIVIVEGVFDAIAVKINAIPLFGKTVGDDLHLKILRNRVSDIYICLDRDAIKNSIKYLETFIGEGRNVYFVDLPGKDPSAIGFEGMRKILTETKQATMADVIKMRMK